MRSTPSRPCLFAATVLAALVSASPVAPQGLPSDEQHTLQAEFWDGLKDKFSDMKGEYDGVKSKVQAITTGVETFGACVAKIPGAGGSPMDVLQDLSSAYENGGGQGVTSHFMQTTVSPLMDRATESIDDVVTGMTEISKSLSNLLSDGQLNTDVLEKLPKQSMALIVSQRTNFPALDCLLADGGFMQHIDDIADIITPFITNMATKVHETIKSIVARLVGPESPLRHLVASLGDKLRDLAPDIDKIDEAGSDAIDRVCTVTTNQLITNSDALCSPSDTSSTFGEIDAHSMIAGSFTAMLTYVTDKVVAWLNEHVWMPVLQQLTQLVVSAQDSLMQVIVGVAGLIPEVGGVIAAALSTVISQIGAQITSVLSRETVQGLITSCEQLIRDQFPIWSKALADVVVDGGNKFRAGAEKLAAPSLAFANDVSDTMSPIIVPLMDVITPMMTSLAAGTFPSISKAAHTCKTNSYRIKQLVMKAHPCK